MNVRARGRKARTIPLYRIIVRTLDEAVQVMTDVVKTYRASDDDSQAAAAAAGAATSSSVSSPRYVGR